MKILYILRHLWLVTEYFIRGWIILALPMNQHKKRQLQARNVSRSARKFLKALNINLILKQEEQLNKLKHQAYLLVANHSSYTDILILASLENLIFITSVEMGNNLFLGAVTRLGGSLFTNRKNPVSLKDEIDRFSQTIADGFKVVLFPEGTSTDGQDIKEFRRSLFQIARNVNCPILPVCIKYTRIDNNKISAANRDLIAWYGDMDFAPHFLKLLGHKIEAEITFLESIVQPAEKTRTELSDGLLHNLRACYHLNTSQFQEYNP